ncbi:MAG: large subunit ribosomal protein L5 [Candidatus Berkelbacteria bacterium Licking1014_2]|uniref:Large ribosomal subunit protein uL5 n=1 Tax=Candidatus Berkelbacteria bacterium Licking1014_2 TaxID=2017146 RepID=A0A554LWW6_9BACT|nr:MAG: large subunit ribosomal protein L5 [Candidatus Berkelbacteria bacterium Licking1014_2]
MKDKKDKKNKIEKIIISVGYGKIRDKQDMIKKIGQQLTKIAGQKPRVTISKKAISGFKLRQGEPVGYQITLRRKKAVDFFGRMVNSAIPRIRDFRGLKADGFDEKGNYNLGINEQTIFPEITPEESEMVFGMNITIVTTASTPETAKESLIQLGFPFK